MRMMVMTDTDDTYMFSVLLMMSGVNVWFVVASPEPLISDRSQLGFTLCWR